MDRGAWQATVHGVSRVGHNLATKRQQNVLTTDEKSPTVYNNFGNCMFPLSLET